MLCCCLHKARRLTAPLRAESAVYLVDANGKVQVRPVTVQGTYQGQWIVTSGLKQGEQVVMVGAAKVKPDQAVKVMPYNASTAAATNMPTSQPTGQAKTAQP